LRNVALGAEESGQEWPYPLRRGYLTRTETLGAHRHKPGRDLTGERLACPRLQRIIVNGPGAR
jgi:hypothetical protein